MVVVPDHDPLHRVLSLLYRATQYGNSTGDVWQYSISGGDMRAQGLHNIDIEFLVQTGLVEHRMEVPTERGGPRAFLPPDRLMHAASNSCCFVLTKSGLEFAGDRLDTVRLGPATAGNDTESPKWDARRRELLFGGKLIKRFQCPAKNQITIISAFHEEGWPCRIDDPLTVSQRVDRKQRLRDTIKSLNRAHVSPNILHFGADGQASGVIWDSH